MRDVADTFEDTRGAKSATVELVSCGSSSLNAVPSVSRKRIP